MSSSELVFHVCLYHNSINIYPRSPILPEVGNYPFLTSYMLGATYMTKERQTGQKCPPHPISAFPALATSILLQLREMEVGSLQIKNSMSSQKPTK